MYNCCIPTCSRVNKTRKAENPSNNYRSIFNSYVVINNHVPNLFYLLCIHQKNRNEGQRPGENPNKTERVINIRPLTMKDLKEAKNQVKKYMDV